jgi:hypothetical protein
VVGAVTLLIVSVISFGSGALFHPTERYVRFPEGAVNGRWGFGWDLPYAGDPRDGRATRRDAAGSWAAEPPR